MEEDQDESDSEIFKSKIFPSKIFPAKYSDKAYSKSKPLNTSIPAKSPAKKNKKKVRTHNIEELKLKTLPIKRKYVFQNSGEKKKKRRLLI